MSEDNEAGIPVVVRGSYIEYCPMCNEFTLWDYVSSRVITPLKSLTRKPSITEIYDTYQCRKCKKLKSMRPSLGGKDLR